MSLAATYKAHPGLRRRGLQGLEANRAGCGWVCKLSKARKGAGVAFIDDYVDHSLDVSAKQTEQMIVDQEIRRLQEMLTQIRAAGEIPRRLSDATPGELARDKRRARRVGHVLEQSLGMWNGKPREPTKEDKRSGAQLSWAKWWGEHDAWLVHRIRYIATWAKRTENEQFGKRAIVRLTQERDWLIYALRD